MRPPRSKTVPSAVVSPSSSPSSAVRVRPHTRASAFSATSRYVQSPICVSECTTDMMQSIDFHSLPVSPPSSDHPNSIDGDGSSLSDESPLTAVSTAAVVRRRRRRIAIELSPDQTGSLSKIELKKLKNRIAAARARERTQKQVEELEATVEQLWRENQQQQAVINHLRGLLHQNTHPPTFAQGFQHAPTSSMPPGGYQDLLSTNLAPSFGPQAMPGYTSTHGGGGDLHAGLLAEFREMFPTSSLPQPDCSK